MNTKSRVVQLEATGVRFFSRCDEDAFFAWLNKLPFIERWEGRGRTIYIAVDYEAVDEDGLREILSLFRRYEVDLRQLAFLDRKEFSDWFHNKKAYWYKDIFD